MPGRTIGMMTDCGGDWHEEFKLPCCYKRLADISFTFFHIQHPELEQCVAAIFPGDVAINQI